MTIDTAEKRSMSKYVCAVLDPSESGQSVERLASSLRDGLCAVTGRFNDQGFGSSLGGREFDRENLDVNVIRQWIGTCERLHVSICKPQISQKLEMISLIDVKTRRLVP